MFLPRYAIRTNLQFNTACLEQPKIYLKWIQNPANKERYRKSEQITPNSLGENNGFLKMSLKR